MLGVFNWNTSGTEWNPYNINSVRSRREQIISSWIVQWPVTWKFVNYGDSVTSVKVLEIPFVQFKFNSEEIKNLKKLFNTIQSFYMSEHSYLNYCIYCINLAHAHCDNLYCDSYLEVLLQLVGKKCK